jgi:uncharacterized protein YjbJ (UPF0337 family)
MKPSTKDQITGKLHEVKGDVKAKAGQVTNWRPKAKSKNSAARSKRKSVRSKKYWKSDNACEA